ncbi:MAG: hypothetical protein ACRD2U_01710 [Terriglobales bacterium]
MWIEKLSGGVLRVLTPLGSRYFRPSFAQRIYLLWIFRNFQTLPAKVLTSRQTRLIDLICARQQFVTLRVDGLALLGTLEERPPATSEELSPRRPNASVADAVRPFAANLRQRF